MDEWVGKRVRLRQTMKNNGGDTFKKGEILKVDSHWRGRLYLWDASTPYCYGEGRRGISHVGRGLVEIVE